MLKKINNFINILMGTFTCVFIGGAVYKYFDYKNHPDLYAMQSPPWCEVLIFLSSILELFRILILDTEHFPFKSM